MDKIISDEYLQTEAEYIIHQSDTCKHTLLRYHEVESLRNKLKEMIIQLHIEKYGEKEGIPKAISLLNKEKDS